MMSAAVGADSYLCVPTLTECVLHEHVQQLSQADMQKALYN